MQETTNATSGEVLRGIELTKRGLFGDCEHVCTYKPTVLGAKAAAAAFKSLSEKHPNAGYELRALVSVPRAVTAEERIHAQEKAAVESGWVEGANGESGL